MDFRGSIAAARSSAWSAIAELDRYDRASSPDAPHNRDVLARAGDWISPGATRHGSAALDAARWERWVTVRQIRDVGTALELLDRAWWGVRPGRVDVDGVRRALHDAVSYLDRADRRWFAPTPWAAPAAPAALLPVSVAVARRVA